MRQECGRSGAAGAAGDAASGAAGAAGSAASGAAGAAGGAASGAAGAAGDAASGAAGAAGSAASGAAGAAGGAASGAAGAAGNAASGVLGGASGPPTRGSAGASIGPGNAPTASIAAPTDEVGARVASLPAGLLPIEAGGGTIGPWVAYVPELGQVHGTKEALSGLARGLKTIPGTPLSAIRACRDRIASLSQPYRAIRVEAAGAGRLAQRRRGLTEAAIWARILYRRAGLTQVRQARVTCQLDARGQVLAVRSGLTS